ncbi:MAG TPA: class I SAM-dependent methyltransferase [Verrucomicrobiae bacterium]|nr:class I SAM-dependent methyltransferase [Verrucomicrobiae bacterium]
MSGAFHRSLQRLLALPVVHYLATRVCGGRIRSLSFDEKYRSGHWNFAGNDEAELIPVIAKYACRGHILILGCGTASIVQALGPENYATILGVDLSSVAIAEAMRYASEKVRFEVGDMVTYEPKEKYAVILFSESLNYVRNGQRLPLLKRLGNHLTADGCFVVTISQADRYAAILDMIRENCVVIEDRSFQGAHRHLLVFR